LGRRRPAESLVLHTQALLQGAFIVAKTKDSSDIAARSGDRLRRMSSFCFDSQSTEERKSHGYE